MGLLQVSITVILLTMILPPCRQEDGLDVGSFLFGPPADKPNIGDVINEEQQSLGTITVDNTPGQDMTLTNNMKDMKDRVEEAAKNISQLKSDLNNHTPSASQTTSTTIAELNTQVESVSSSTSKVQESLSALKNRLSNMKQTTSTSSDLEGTSVQTDRQMADNEQKKNDLHSQIPDLEKQVDISLNDLTNEGSDLDHLSDLVTATTVVEERDDTQLVANMEQTMSETAGKMDSMPGKMDDHCQLLDKQVMLIQGTNVVGQGEMALLKYTFVHAEASSTFEGGDAMNAIDGSTEVYFYTTPNHCQATNYEWGGQPWLQLTLPEQTNVGGVRVLARGDCCYELTYGVQVDTNAYNPAYYSHYYEDCTETEHLNAGSYANLLCKTFRRAQYIKLTATKHSQVSFCEVEALGVPLDSVSYGQPAMQSSTASSETSASLATDSNPNTCSLTLTGNEGGDPWWQVDLGSSLEIYLVSLTFREGSTDAARQNVYVYMYSVFPLTCDATYSNLCGNTNSVNSYTNVYEIRCSVMYRARYLRVVKKGAQSQDYLELCEVKTTVKS